MTTTESFLQLYREQTSHIESGSPQLLNKARSQAAELIEEKGLPHTWSEDYKRFDIDKVLSMDWNYSFEDDRTAQKPKIIQPCALPGLNSYHYFIAEDHIYPINKKSQTLPEGVFVGRIHDFIEKHADIAEKYYNRMNSVAADPLSALNTLLVQEVCVIYLPAHTEMPEPIQITNNSGINAGRCSMPRFLIIAEEHSRVALLFCDHTHTKHSSLHNRVVEIYANDHSHVEYYDIEESDQQTIRLQNLHVHQESNSEVLIDSLTIQNGLTRNNFYADLAGAHASFDLDGMCILDSDQSADNYSFIQHSVSECHSDELFKYTLDDRARGSFSGRIYVARDAQKTTAYQNNRNLSLSPTAKMYSKPQLEIYADDVKCSHGMTTGQLDEKALFYMRQRGIPFMEAKLMLTIAFMSDVLNTIKLVPLRDRLHQVVEKRFRGLPAGCYDKCQD